MPTDAIRSSNTSTASVRIRAGACVLVLILVGMAMGVACEKTWGQALVNATLGSLAGLACWSVYHLVCRQNNGLILVGMFLAPLITGKPRPVGPFWIFWLSLTAGLGLMFGAWARWRDGLPGDPVQPGVGER